MRERSPSESELTPLERSKRRLSATADALAELRRLGWDEQGGARAGAPAELARRTYEKESGSR